MKTYRLAILGLVHDHVWGILDEFVATGRVELVGVAEPSDELRARALAKYGNMPAFADYKELLANVDADIATVYVENACGHPIVEACAAKGVHVMSEKPMAARLWQADAMLDAAEKAGITLFINWATAWDPCLAAAIAKVQSGGIGQLYKVRNICSHGGPKEIGCAESFWSWLHDEELNGAGALMDYCCYGAALCALFLGSPRTVTGIRGTYVKEYLKVDDNAVILAAYDKAMAVLEASWTEATHLYAEHFQGTTGDIFCQEGEAVLVDKAGRHVLDAPALPAHMANGPVYFLHCLDTGEAVGGLCNARVSRDAQEILEAGKRAADTGKAVTLPVAP